MIPPLELLVIGYWLLRAGLQPCNAGLKSRLQKDALRSSAPKFSILNSQFSIKKQFLTRGEEYVS